MTDFIKGNLESLLEFVESNIDIEHCNKVESIHLKALNFNDNIILPLSIIPEIDDELFYPYKEAFNDPEKMMYNELLMTCGGSIYSSVQTKDYFPLHIRSNHGIGIIPSLFGLDCKIINNNMPWVEHVESKGEIEKIIFRGVPEINDGLGKKVLATHQFYLEKLESYPKCSKAIKISQPDMQGPFDIAHLIIGTDIFYMVVDNPDLLHKLLELITETYISFRKNIDPYIKDNTSGDAVYVHGGIYPGKVVIKDDTAVTNLSPEMYREFSWKYNRKILEEFGGCLHSCGNINSWVYENYQKGLPKGFNFGNPELQEMKDVIKGLIKKEIGVITWGYNQEYSFLKNIFDSDINTGITLACTVQSIKEGRQIMKDYFKGKNI